MPPLKIEVTDWKKTVSAVLLVPLIHPVVALASDLIGGKPLRKSLIKFAAICFVYLLIGLTVVARMLFSGGIRRIIADENGLQIQVGRGWRRLAWHQIATLERSMRPEGKTLKRRLTLRDAGGAILAEIPRELQESAPVRAGFDAIEARLVAQVGKRGLIAPSLDAPLSKTAFALKNPYQYVGWFTFAMFLPSAILSWQFIPAARRWRWYVWDSR